MGSAGEAETPATRPQGRTRVRAGGLASFPAEAVASGRFPASKRVETQGRPSASPPVSRGGGSLSAITVIVDICDN